MNTVLRIVKWVFCFIILNIYANGLPKYLNNNPESGLAQLFTENSSYWIFYWLSFFFFTFLIAKYVLNILELKSFGLGFGKKWFNEVLLGFFIGFTVWSFKNLIFFGVGMFEISGVVDVASAIEIVALGLLIAIFPSLINDVLIRGYWMAGLKQVGMMKWYIIFTSVIYALDDFWNEGFSLSNTAFSLALGLTLAYTVWKSGRIWMCFGIHMGSNFIYRLMYGMNGQGIFNLDNIKEGILYEYINIILVVVMFPCVYLILNKKHGRKNCLSTFRMNSIPEVEAFKIISK